MWVEVITLVVAKLPRKKTGKYINTNGQHPCLSSASLMMQKRQQLGAYSAATPICQDIEMSSCRGEPESLIGFSNKSIVSWLWLTKLRATVLWASFFFVPNFLVIIGNSLQNRKFFSCSRWFLRLICHEMSPSQVREQDLSQLKKDLSCDFKWFKSVSQLWVSSTFVRRAHVHGKFITTVNVTCSSRMIISFLLLSAVSAARKLSRLWETNEPCLWSTNVYWVVKQHSLTCQSTGSPPCAILLHKVSKTN